MSGLLFHFITDGGNKKQSGLIKMCKPHQDLIVEYYALNASVRIAIINLWISIKIPFVCYTVFANEDIKFGSVVGNKPQALIYKVNISGKIGKAFIIKCF